MALHYFLSLSLPIMFVQCSKCTLARVNKNKASRTFSPLATCVWRNLIKHIVVGYSGDKMHKDKQNLLIPTLEPLPASLQILTVNSLMPTTRSYQRQTSLCRLVFLSSHVFQIISNQLCLCVVLFLFSFEQNSSAKLPIYLLVKSN